MCIKYMFFLILTYKRFVVQTEAPQVECVFGFEYLERLDRLERLRAFIDKGKRVCMSARAHVCVCACACLSLSVVFSCC